MREGQDRHQNGEGVLDWKEEEELQRYEKRLRRRSWLERCVEGPLRS
jgi:hypothetical protein